MCPAPRRLPIALSRLPCHSLHRSAFASATSTASGLQASPAHATPDRPRCAAPRSKLGSAARPRLFAQPILRLRAAPRPRPPPYRFSLSLVFIVVAQDFLEASPYTDQSGVPINTYKNKSPHTGKVVSTKRIVGAAVRPSS